MKNDGQSTTSIICRVPDQMLAAMDQAAAELRLTRSSFVREAIHERIARYEREERELVMFLRRQAEAVYGVDSQKEGE